MYPSFDANTVFCDSSARNLACTGRISTQSPRLKVLEFFAFLKRLPTKPTKLHEQKRKFFLGTIEKPTHKL